MSKVVSCPASVTIADTSGNEFECLGRYYGDGRILCVHEGGKLMVDPECYHSEDPKRLFTYPEPYRWTKLRVKSVILAISKNQ